MTSLGPAWQRVRGLTNHEWVMLPFAILTLSLYLGAYHTRGFIPHDDGLLAQSAERVLRGEWPHRDFDDPYTGALTLLHACAMRVFGVELLALRRLLLIASIGFSVVVYRLARRAASPALAAFVTWVAMAWAMPNYFAALPSWYNLMLAATALLFVLRAAERGRTADVVLAGVCGGLSLLVKVVGVFHIAASILGLLFVALSRATPAPNPRTARAVHACVRVCGLIFAFCLTLLLPADSSLMDRLHFTLPAWILAWVLIVEDLRVERSARAPRFGSLVATLASYAAGVALPLAVFVWPYVASESVNLLAYDVFVAPQRRISRVSFALPPLSSLVFALPLACVVLAPATVSRIFERPRVLLPLAALASVALVFGGKHDVYTTVWMSLRPLVPIATLGAALLLNRAASTDPLRRTQLFCVVAMTALASLVQFPYSFAVYFLYVAPLLVLAILFIAFSQSSAPRALWFALACFHLGFALLWVNTGDVAMMGIRYFADSSDTYLALPRGRLKVSPVYVRAYTDLVRTIEAHSAPGAYIYAAPDCPEVYFLSGRRNPTRTFYDLFDRDYGEAREARVRRILETLDSHSVDVTVFCRHPEFSEVSTPLLQQLERRYPRHADVPPLFSVRYRDRTDTQHADSRR